MELPALEAERPLRTLGLAGDDEKLVRGFQLLSAKPLLVVVNVDEAEVAELLGRDVPLLANWVDGVTVAPGQLVLLENCRVNVGEKNNDQALARKLAALCHIFVHDAFGTAHRAEASTYGIAQYAPIACAGPLLAAEIDAISQALANLVENAIKYGKPLPSIQPGAVDGANEILIEARRDGATVLLSVTDHGPGIPEADRSHAVERFVRLEASRTQPGSGLGLSLASAVATLHGGELRLGDNNPGLTVTLAIPARAGASDRLAVQTPDVPQKVA